MVVRTVEQHPFLTAFDGAKRFPPQEVNKKSTRRSPPPQEPYRQPRSKYAVLSLKGMLHTSPVLSWGRPSWSGGYPSPGVTLPPPRKTCDLVMVFSILRGISVVDRRYTGKTQKFEFSSTTFTTVFKICLYVRHFDSSVCPHKIFWWHFADSSKLLKNHFVNELDLTSFKFSAIKWFFKSLEELAKWHQKILHGHTDESKHLA